MTQKILVGFLLFYLPFNVFPQKGYTINCSIPASQGGNLIYMRVTDYSKMNKPIIAIAANANKFGR